MRLEASVAHRKPLERADSRTARLRRGTGFAGLCLAVALGLGLVAPGIPFAQAENPSTGSSPVTTAIPSEFQQRVEETSAAYNEAVAAREELERQAAEAQARIDEINAQLPAAQDAAAEAMATLYKYQQNGNGILALIISTDEFSTFITTTRYLSVIQESNVEQIEELVALAEELAQQQTVLEESLAQAREQEAAAQSALDEAIAAREEAQRRAEEEARRRAEEAAAAAAAAAAQQAAQQQGSSASGTTPTGDAGAAGDTGQSADVPSQDTSTATEPETPSDTGGSSSGNVDWSSDKSSFVAQWAGRIDAYLAGSPLAGQGTTFASAAWDYGVDPRWSPAIAYVESSLGAYCFLPHNAWGWGSSSWGSWEEAIYAHVAGLARGYGYTISYEAALKYCPPNADEWYAICSTQMSYI